MTRSMRLAIVAGARPNFMKIAPLLRALRERGHRDWFLVHTGQHYDDDMSRIFFEQLELPEPDVSLGVGSGSQADQTARIMTGFEPVCLERRPQAVVVVGDVNSTLAATLVASKLSIPVAHVEAGLRSRDRSMPEEINRIVTDVLSEWLFAPSADAVENLRAEGIDPAKIHLVGNIMVDSLLRHLPAIDWRRALDDLDLLDAEGAPRPYAVLTLHRPSNVDVGRTFDRLMTAIEEIARRIPVIFPVHPRVRGQVLQRPASPGLRIVDPLGYLEFLALVSRARFVMTDSGGLQEETAVLGVPCITLRETTERPVTVECGTNVIVGTSPERLRQEAERAMNGTRGASRLPDSWDGRTADRIVEVLLRAGHTT